MSLDPEYWKRILNDILADVMAWLPALAGAIVLLLLGWMLARLFQALVAGLLRRLGLDRLAERAGATQVLTNAGLDPSSANLVARVVYWLILLVFVLAATESLGLRGLAETLGGLVAYLPKVLAAALILLVGGLLARVVGDALGVLATQSGISAGLLLGQAIRYVLLIFVVLLALEQLGLETALLTMASTALVAALALALAVAFGWGSRELARNIMAGFHAREEFTVGQHLTVQGHTGRLASIGSVKSVIEMESERVSLPNSVLIEQEVTLIGDDAEKPL